MNFIPSLPGLVHDKFLSAQESDDLTFYETQVAILHCNGLLVRPLPYPPLPSSNSTCTVPNPVLPGPRKQAKILQAQEFQWEAVRSFRSSSERTANRLSPKLQPRPQQVPHNSRPFHSRHQVLQRTDWFVGGRRSGSRVCMSPSL